MAHSSFHTGAEVGNVMLQAGLSLKGQDDSIVLKEEWTEPNVIKFPSKTISAFMVYWILFRFDH